MDYPKIIKTEWHSDKKLIVTQLRGDVEMSDVERWETSFKNALGQIEDNGVFKIFVNLFGFKAADIEAHKRYRNIIPQTLADYGWKVGYVDLFEESKDMVFKNIRGIRCVGAAHVHQDETKIEKYETNFGRENERFFTDPEKADEWIRALKIAD
ncbi:MAG: hypothetical protein V4642_05240 [Bacteroidota bacterium]